MYFIDFCVNMVFLTQKVDTKDVKKNITNYKISKSSIINIISKSDFFEMTSALNYLSGEIVLKESLFSELV